MEIKEIFRAQNVRLRKQDGSVCTLSFNLIAGEFLGVHVPRIQQEKSVISRAVMNEDVVKSGGLFYYETEYGDTPPFQGWPTVACIQAKNSLVEEMSVMDNLFLLRRRKNKDCFYSNRQLMWEAARQLEAFGLPFQPHQTVSSLSKFEKYVLEVFKVYLHGAQIIILDQIVWDSAESSTVKLLLALIGQLKKEGITFLIISDRLNNLRSCADRITFFDGRQIISILENIPENREAISETFDTLVRDFERDRHRITYLERGKQITFRDPILASLNLFEGERVALYDTQGIIAHHIEDVRYRKRVPLTGGYIVTGKSKQNKWKEHPRTIVADFGRYDHVFESLSVIDNVLLGRSDGIQMLKIVGSKYRKMLKREFAEQFGDADMLDIKESRLLTSEQCLKLYLFKLKLMNPDVVIAWRNPKADPVLVKLLVDTMAAFAEDNRTVCYLLMDVFEQVENVQRYICVTEHGIESFSTYGALLRNQMMWKDPNPTGNHG